MESLTVQSQALADPAAIAAAEGVKAMIQAAYVTAWQRPRNQDQARAKILAACRRPEFAARVQYSKPVGGQKLTGPSIRLAELAVREWGNIRSDIQVVYEDRQTKRIKINLLDLETNASFAKEITVSKTVERRDGKGREILGERLNSSGHTVFIVAATDDEIQTKESAMVSKVIRNEGLRLIPSDIVDEALEIARETLASRDCADPETAKKRMVNAFSELGIWPQDLEQYLKHPLAQITATELSDLRTVYQALKDGDAKWADYVEPAAAGEQKPTAAEVVKERITRSRKPAEKPTDQAPPPSEPAAEPQKAPGIPELLTALKTVGLDAKLVAEFLRAEKIVGPTGDLFTAPAATRNEIMADPQAFSRRVSQWVDAQMEAEQQ